MRHIRTILSLSLAALVLLASSSFYVGIHVCRGKVKAVALLDEADGCGHKTMPPCHRSMMDNCCDNEQIEHEASVVQLVQYSVNISPVFYLITSIDLPDLSKVFETVSSFPLAFAPEDPPTSCGRIILSLIHILRI